ncbi:MAG: GAF domain-containing protein [Chloroflexota bacterium]
MKSAAERPSLARDAILPERAFQILHELAVATGGVLDPSEVARMAAEGARELLGVDSAGLVWWDPQARELRSLGETSPQLDGTRDRPSDMGATGTAFSRREAVLVDDYVSYRAARPAAVKRGLRSVASVPLVVRDRAVGALTVRTSTPRSWSDEDARLLGLLAAQVAPTIEAARLRTESEQRRAEAETLAELVRVGATERNLDRVINLICEQAAKLVGADYDGIALVEPDGSRTWRGMWGNRSQSWQRQTQGRGKGALGQMLREGRTVVLENLGDDPGSVAYTHVQEGGKTVLSTPLVIRDNVLGGLTLGWRTAVKPTPDQIRLAEALAGYAATVLENARAYAEQEAARARAESVAETLSQRERALRALHEVAVAASGLLNSNTLGQLVIHSARGMLGFDSAGLYLWDADSGALQPLAETDLDRGLPRLKLEPGSGVASQAYESGQTVVVEDYPAWSGRLDIAVERGVKSAVAVPLRVEERSLGVLVVRSRRPRQFEAEEIHLLELLAAQVAPALDAARLHAESEQRRVEAEAMADLARQGAAAHEIGPVVDLVCDRARWLIGADFAALLTQASGGGVAWLGVSGNRSDMWKQRHRSSRRGPAMRSMAEGRAVLLRRGDSAPDGSLDGLAVMGAEGAETALAVPLLRRDGPFGALVTGWRRPRDVTPAQRSLAEALGGYAAAVLDNALSHAESERRRVEAETLAELARQGALEHDTEQLISLICRQATKLAGADYAGLRLVDEAGGLRWDGMVGNRSDAWRTRTQSKGRGSASLAIQAGKTIVRHTIDLAAGDPASVRASEGGMVELSTPLVYRGTSRGAIVLGWRQDLDPSEDEIRVAEALAGYAAVILENAHAHIALAQQALYDELTELPNRRLFQDRLEQAILGARRDGRPIALLLMDLDRFKEVNDTLGHQAGDVLLREIAFRLRSALRTSDTVARLGGDEFAVVLTSMRDSASASVAASKLLAALAEPIALRGQPLQVAGSIGIALSPEHGDDPETLLRHADVAMYVAKRTGGGAAVYAPDMDRDHAAQLALVQDLRRAIQEGQLTLQYQPLLNLATRSAGAVEALVRWNHPERGAIGPAQFIPLAEQTGLIRQVSRWVLGAVFEQRRAWRGAGLDLKIAVNLSMRDLHDPSLPDGIDQLAKAFREDPKWLVVEITESAVMSDPTATQRALMKLRAMGTRIAIDDFGTGYSSLSYLNQLSVDEIKVDRAFVHGMARHPKSYAIVRAAIEMGHALGASVIAEGVENKPDLDLLEKLGCDGAQGFHICKPLPPADLVCWLKDRQVKPI